MSLQILMAVPPLKDAVGATLADCQITPCVDGISLLAEYVRRLRAKQPPVMLVCEFELAGLSGQAAIRAIRAAERGLGVDPVPILAYAAQRADQALTAFIGQVGHLVHLRRPDTTPPDEQARRLDIALGKLLTQLGKR